MAPLVSHWGKRVQAALGDLGRHQRDRQLLLQAHVAVDVVDAERVLVPGEAEILDRLADLERFAVRVAPRRVEHQRHVGPDRIAHGGARRDVVGDRHAVAPERRGRRVQLVRLPALLLPVHRLVGVGRRRRRGGCPTRSTPAPSGGTCRAARARADRRPCRRCPTARCRRCPLRSGRRTSAAPTASAATAARSPTGPTRSGSASGTG